MNTFHVFAPSTHRTQEVAVTAQSAKTLTVKSARNDAALREALAAADEMATFGLLQNEWAQMLLDFPEFADELEAEDPYVCCLTTLAKLIAQAPTSAIRQALREAVYCREQMAKMLGLDSTPASEQAAVVLAGAEAEWEILLASQPVYGAWLSTLDRFTCSRASLAEAMHLAPTETIRHALRETFSFREVAALMSVHAFA